MTDEDIQSSVLEIAGTNVSTAYITCPADPAKTLGIKLPFLVMVIKNMNKYFSFEVQASTGCTCWDWRGGLHVRAMAGSGWAAAVTAAPLTVLYTCEQPSHEQQLTANHLCCHGTLPILPFLSPLQVLDDKNVRRRFRASNYQVRPAEGGEQQAPGRVQHRAPFLPPIHLPCRPPASHPPCHPASLLPTHTTHCSPPRASSPSSAPCPCAWTRAGTRHVLCCLRCWQGCGGCIGFAWGSRQPSSLPCCARPCNPACAAAHPSPACPLSHPTHHSPESLPCLLRPLEVSQVQFNLADFVKRAYGTNYVETLRVQVGG